MTPEEKIAFLEGKLQNLAATEAAVSKLLSSLKNPQVTILAPTVVTNVEQAVTLWQQIKTWLRELLKKVLVWLA